MFLAFKSEQVETFCSLLWTEQDLWKLKIYTFDHKGHQNQQKLKVPHSSFK